MCSDLLRVHPKPDKPSFMKPFSSMLIITLLLGLGCQPATEPGGTDSSGPPNIILVFADDLGYGDLSCYGHPTIRTPRLDELARKGIKLSSFYAAASVCTPSRAGLLTGRFPIRFGMEGNRGPDSRDGIAATEITLAEALKEQGYRTACFGKWHLGAVSGHFPTEHGFDEYLGILYSNDMMPPWVKTERPLHLYRDTVPTEEYPVDQTTLVERYTEETVRFVKESKAEGKPFFVYLPHAMPHLPVSTSERFAGTSAGGRYGDVIETLDWSMGRLVDMLEEEGLAENTLVIFTSDNGPWNQMPPRMYNTEPVELWDAGSTGALRGTKGTSWEGGLRVPFIAYWPGHIPPNQLSPEPVSTLDLFPTLVKLAGGEVPTDRPMDGQDIWPFLSGEAASPRTEFFYYRGKTLEGVREEDWKLMWKPEDGELKARLFHLGQDPYERFDLADAYPNVVAQLKAKMEAFAEETAAQLHVNN